jgi:CRISPR/Cas system CMR-associated protein Cmr5 small subunit
MPNLYILVYNHPPKESIKKRLVKNETAKGFINNYNNWLYDVGDDPSFYCSNILGTNLSWGICRPDIRNKIQPNDTVVFFCYNGIEQKYYLVALATVKEKIKQTDIWTNNDYSSYRKHFNLLIRLNNGLWEHYEPLFNEKGKHKNWAHRIASDFPNDTFQSMENNIILNFPIRDNYVLFKKNDYDTYVLTNPILVAKWSKGQNKESWHDSDNSKSIKDMIFRETHRDSLRVHPKNQGHVHIRIEKNENELTDWKRKFIDFFKKIGN